MIKRLIFDLDDTLIDWKNEFYVAWVKALEDFQIQCDENVIQEIDRAISHYESENIYYDKKKMTEYIKNDTKLPITEEALQQALKNLEDAIPEPNDPRIIETKETLEYLYPKYELVVLSNWFYDSQVGRLRKSGLLQFFQKVYCSEEFPAKPDQKSFKIASGDKKVSDCIMIGDNYKLDILGALNVGMNAIFFNRKKIQVDNSCEVIYNIKELKTLL